MCIELVVLVKDGDISIVKGEKLFFLVFFFITFN